jgi:hypothetical protein
VKTPGLRIGGVGVIRFEAEANHSSLKERMVLPRGADMRSGVGMSVLGMDEEEQMAKYLYTGS